MKKIVKLIIASGCILLLGIILISVSVGVSGFDTSGISAGGKKHQMTYQCDAQTNNIKLSDNNTGVTVRTGDVDTISIVYWENEEEKYTISENNGSIDIDKVITYQWFDYIMWFDIDTYNIEVTVPQEFDGTLNLKTSNAKIDVADLSAAEARIHTSNAGIILDGINVKDICDIKNSNGKVEISSSVMNKLKCETSNAQVVIDKAVVNTDIKCDNSNAKIILSNSEAASLILDTNNGIVEISDDTITGDIDIKNSNAAVTVSSVLCETIDIDTSNGRIEFESLDAAKSITCKNSNGRVGGTIVGSEEDFNIQASTSNASSNLSNSTKDADKTLKIKTNNASINIEFED